MELLDKEGVPQHKSRGDNCGCILQQRCGVLNRGKGHYCGHEDAGKEIRTLAIENEALKEMLGEANAREREGGVES